MFNFNVSFDHLGWGGVGWGVGPDISMLELGNNYDAIERMDAHNVKMPKNKKKTLFVMQICFVLFLNGFRSFRGFPGTPEHHTDFY